MKKTIFKAAALLTVSAVLVPLAAASGPAPGATRVQPAAIQAGDVYGGQESLFQINMNLPAGHPCAQYGGEWRGWCMNIDGSMVMPSGRKSARYLPMNARRTQDLYERCADIVNRTERRRCYREDRAALYGQTRSPSNTSYRQIQLHRNLYYYFSN